MKPVDSRKISPFRGMMIATAITAALATGEAKAKSADIDGDGISNLADPDVDGDGIPNGKDRNVDGGICLAGPFKGKFVGDPLPNGARAEKDIDGDGFSDDSEAELDIDGDGKKDDATREKDIDGDGIGNSKDHDRDGDGKADDRDDDDDGDGRGDDDGTGEDDFFQDETIVGTPGEIIVVGEENIETGSGDPDGIGSIVGPVVTVGDILSPGTSAGAALTLQGTEQSAGVSVVSVLAHIDPEAIAGALEWLELSGNDRPFILSDWFRLTDAGSEGTGGDARRHRETENLATDISEEIANP